MAPSALPPPKIKKQKNKTPIKESRRSIFSPLEAEKETVIYEDTNQQTGNRTGIIKTEDWKKEKGSTIGSMAQSTQQPSNYGSAGVEEAPESGGSFY